MTGVTAARKFGERGPSGFGVGDSGEGLTRLPVGRQIGSQRGAGSSRRARGQAQARPGRGEHDAPIDASRGARPVASRRRLTGRPWVQDRSCTWQGTRAVRFPVPGRRCAVANRTPCRDLPSSVALRRSRPAWPVRKRDSRGRPMTCTQRGRGGRAARGFRQILQVNSRYIRQNTEMHTYFGLVIFSSIFAPPRNPAPGSTWRRLVPRVVHSSCGQLRGPAGLRRASPEAGGTAAGDPPPPSRARDASRISRPPAAAATPAPTRPAVRTAGRSASPGRWPD